MEQNLNSHLISLYLTKEKRKHYRFFETDIARTTNGESVSDWTEGRYRRKLSEIVQLLRKLPTIV